MKILSNKKYKELLNKYSDEVERFNFVYHENNDLKKEQAEIHKENNRLMEQNEELTKWIIKILHEIGTMETSEREQFRIPIFKMGNYSALGSHQILRERIEIPRIVIEKSELLR